MPIPFSESTFAFAYTREISNLWGQRLLPPPIFPTAMAESRLGFDVVLNGGGFLYCVQFKLSRLLIGKNAREARMGWPVPYYRFPISHDRQPIPGVQGMSRHSQYDNLCRLERLPRVLVEYAAPLFPTDWEPYWYYPFQDFYRHYIYGEIVKNSMRIMPSCIGTLQYGKHYIVSSPDGSKMAKSSELEELRAPYNHGEITESGFESPQFRDRPEPGEPSIRDTLRRFILEFGEPYGVSPRAMDDEDLIAACHFLARALFDVHLFTVSSRPIAELADRSN